MEEQMTQIKEQCRYRIKEIRKKERMDGRRKERQDAW